MEEKDKDGVALIVRGQYGCISGGGRGCDHRLGSLNVLGWSALSTGCISSLGFS